MVVDIIEQIQKIIEYSINADLTNLEKTPKEIRKMQYYVSYLCFTSLNALKLTQALGLEKKDSFYNALMYMIEIGAIKDSPIKIYQKLNDRVKDMLDGLYQQFALLDIKEKNIGEIYEQSLVYDIHLKEGILKYDINKMSRDRSGAYYTPLSFANKSVQRTVDLFLEHNLGFKDFSKNSDKMTKDRVQKAADLLSGASIIDFSCGTGHFFISLINYIKANFNGDKEMALSLVSKVIDNIWGIDVDDIALQIVRINLVIETGNLDSINKVNEQLVVGNPLIEVEEEFSDTVKIDTFAYGIIYSPRLGLNLNKRFCKTKEGFDLILGNPPWEKIRFEEKKFFSVYDVGIDKISQKKGRLKEIEKLRTSNQPLFDYYVECNKNLNDAKIEIKNNSKLNLSLSGELNTYALFAELAVNSLSSMGELCLILKSSIITSTNNKTLFRHLVNEGYISRIYEFVNRDKIFAIDSRERFCVLYANRRNNKAFLIKMNLTEEKDVVELDDLSVIDKKVIKAINPKTNMLPNVSSDKELEFLIKISKKFKGFERIFPDCNFGRLVHFTSHSDYIHKTSNGTKTPVYEGKFFEQYDGKFSTFEGVDYDDRYIGKASSVSIKNEEKGKDIYPVARYFIEPEKWRDITKNYEEEFTLMWRSLTSSTNTRITVATILPHMPTSQSVQLLQHKDPVILIILLALFNSIVFDYIVKLKLNGIDLTQTIIKQIPVPDIKEFEKETEFKGRQKAVKEHIIDRVYTLLMNDKRLVPLFDKLLYNPIKLESGQVDKKKIMSEIDYIIAELYGIEQHQLKDIAMQFKNFYSTADIEKFF